MSFLSLIILAKNLTLHPTAYVYSLDHAIFYTLKCFHGIEIK